MLHHYPLREENENINPIIWHKTQRNKNSLLSINISTLNSKWIKNHQRTKKYCSIYLIASILALFSFNLLNIGFLPHLDLLKLSKSHQLHKVILYIPTKRQLHTWPLINSSFPYNSQWISKCYFNLLRDIRTICNLCFI